MQTALVERARSGDEEAFTCIARASSDRLLAIAFRIVRDVGLAEDAVQQTLVTAWRELPKLRDPVRFDAWVHRLLVHHCYREARRRRAWAGNVRELTVVDRTDEDSSDAIADRDELERGFRRLAPEQRAVFVFHHYLGLSLDEVADQLGIPIGTAKSRLHYATASLRAAIEADLRPGLELSTERPA